MLLENIKKPNIIVFGDIILDNQINGNIKRLANEAPIPIVLYNNNKYSLGGCGNVLANLYSLNCNNLYLFSKIGNDTNGKKIEELIQIYNNVESYFIKSDNIETTMINRYFVDNKIIFRHDIDTYSIINYEDEEYIYNKFLTVINNISCIVFSDYNRGFLTKSLCQRIIKKANELNIFTCVDPKNDYTKYIGCSLIKPNRIEVEKIFGKTIVFDNLFETHKYIQKEVQCKNVLITLAEKGISLYNDKESIYLCNNETIDVIDVTGAGDIVNSLICYYFPLIEDKKFILEITNYIATQSVKKSGTYIIRREDILLAEKHFKINKLICVNDIQYLNTSIIFTNGCFDILHKGHIELFKYCKNLNNNNNVVVAINSDNSIKRLKGSTRPINNLDSRISLLNAISDIDWIIVFDEDTPTETLKVIQPDVLVKGGDYTIDQLPGKEYAKEVKIFNYLDGYSSTNIINRISSFS